MLKKTLKFSMKNVRSKSSEIGNNNISWLTRDNLFIIK